KPDGQPMSEDDWRTGFSRTLGVFLNGKAIPTPDAHGDPIIDDSVYILFNAHYEPMTFKLPASDWGDHWVKIVDTNRPVPDLREHHQMRAGDELLLESHSMIVLRRVD